jgi:hypothetical protein
MSNEEMFNLIEEYKRDYIRPYLAKSNFHIAEKVIEECLDLFFYWFCTRKEK